MANAITPLPPAPFSAPLAPIAPDDDGDDDTAADDEAPANEAADETVAAFIVAAAASACSASSGSAFSVVSNSNTSPRTLRGPDAQMAVDNGHEKK